MREPRIRRLLSVATSRRSIERDVDTEMRFHMQMRVEDLMREGQAREAAERQAAREYGDIVGARDELAAIDRRRIRSESRREWLGSLGQDISFGARSHRTRPALDHTVIFTLALGIGALLQGYSAGADLAQFIGTHETAAGTVVSIDIDGAGSAHGFQDLLLLQGVTGLDFGSLIGHVDPAPLP